jgi:ABC-type nitrate/sulfonate/bicarbonate transport system permease component
MKKSSMQALFDNLGRYLRPTATVLLLIAIWWLASTFDAVNRLFLPSLSQMACGFGKMLSDSAIYVDTFITAYRALVGLVLAICVGVPAGLVMGRNPRLYQYIEMPADFFRSIPSSALFFLFILFFGLGDGAKIAVVFYGCSLIMLVNAVDGASPNREKQDRINMLLSFRATAMQVFFLTVLRDALPHITTGVRVCASLSLVLVIVTEMFLGATSGLGRVIYDAYLSYRIPEMYAAIIILGVLGFVINKLCLLLERRAMFWKPPGR